MHINELIFKAVDAQYKQGDIPVRIVDGDHEFEIVDSWRDSDAFVIRIQAAAEPTASDIPTKLPPFLGEGIRIGG